MRLKAVILPRTRTKIVNGEKVTVVEDRVIMVGFRPAKADEPGKMLIIDGKDAYQYTVQEIPSFTGSRGFIAANEWPDDKPNEYVDSSYQVLICDEQEMSTCSCAGFLSRGKACKHIAALASIVKEGHFPDRNAGKEEVLEYSCKVCRDKFTGGQLVFNRMIPAHGLNTDDLSICKGSYASPVEPMPDLEPLHEDEFTPNGLIDQY